MKPNYLLYYQIFRFCKLSADKWFQVYLKVVYFISVVGLFTFVVKCITGMDIFPYTFDGVNFNPVMADDALYGYNSGDLKLDGTQIVMRVDETLYVHYYDVVEE